MGDLTHSKCGDIQLAMMLNLPSPKPTVMEDNGVYQACRINGCVDTGEDLYPSDWLSVVENPGAIKSLYISHPSLASVELHRLSFSESGWPCTVVVSSDSIPSNPPVKWKKPFNRVHIELGFVGIENVVMNGWPWKRQVEVKMTRQGDKVELSAKGEAISLSIMASEVRVCGIRAVLVDESAANW